MEPTFFGNPPLFGLYHSPDPAVPARDVGVLICPPVGHEHTRTHRALRILGESLARAGFHVLRFDYRGIGDSWGNSGDGTVEGWCEDIEIAFCELHALSGVRELVVVGLRLGAALAVRTLGMRSAARKHLRIRQLVMWDPVLSGADFLKAARKIHSAFRSDIGSFPKGCKSDDGDLGTRGVEYLLGYAYPSAQCVSLEQMDLTRCDRWPDVATSLVLSSGSPPYDRFAGQLRATGRLVGLEMAPGNFESWDDYASFNEMFRAGLAVRAVTIQLDGVRA